MRDGVGSAIERVADSTASQIMRIAASLVWGFGPEYRYSTSLG